MAQIISADTIKANRRKGTIEELVPFSMDGKIEALKKKIVNGEMEAFELGKPIGEMMTSATARKELVQKVVLDVELGREEVPVLYRPIYERIEDSNFPKEFEAKWAQYGTVVFFEHLEGEEVKFGSLQAEEGPIARIKGYAAGFEYTKEMEMFNQTFNFEMLNKAFGEAHNAILNHLHLGPIIQHTYKSANKTGPIYVDKDLQEVAQGSSHYMLSMRETLKQGLKTTREKKRPGTILLANSADQYDIEEAIQSININGTTMRSLEGIDQIVYYDGWEADVGKKKHNYPGVAAGNAYLIRPKRGFKELIKQALQINATMGDMTRLIESQVVGDFWRGVFAALDENVQEITLPSKS